jgi:mannose-6-phosphate isomerase
MTRCNCDASCGENRYHNVGDTECRFRNEDEYDSYWRNRRHPELTTKSPGVKVMEEMPKHSPYIESMKRPWGEWHVLDVDQGYKVKRLEILPDQAISLQYHNHRSEYWTIVQGEGKVIVDGNIFTIRKGESFHVPKMALHKITNTHLTETLIAIEVQMGEICSEDDIVRC